MELCGILDNTTEASAGVITINIPESDFTGDSCTILDALHNFGNVSAAVVTLVLNQFNREREVGVDCYLKEKLSALREVFQLGFSFFLVCVSVWKLDDFLQKIPVVCRYFVANLYTVKNAVAYFEGKRSGVLKPTDTMLIQVVSPRLERDFTLGVIGKVLKSRERSDCGHWQVPSPSSFIERVTVGKAWCWEWRAANVNLLVLLSGGLLSCKHSPQAVLAVAAVP